MGGGNPIKRVTKAVSKAVKQTESFVSTGYDDIEKTVSKAYDDTEAFVSTAVDDTAAVFGAGGGSAPDATPSLGADVNTSGDSSEEELLAKPEDLKIKKKKVIRTGTDALKIPSGTSTSGTVGTI